METSTPEHKVMIFEISGQALISVIKKSKKENKKLAIVYDYDNEGIPVRVGYKLIPNKNKEDSIIWFKEEEIKIKNSLEEKLNENKATLSVNFIHKKANEKVFLISCPITHKICLLFRLIHRFENSNDISFVIQVEIKKIENKSTIPIVRYDCAHGFIHRDLIYKNGKQKKYSLPVQDKVKAVIYAVDEIVSNFQHLYQESNHENFIFSIKEDVVLLNSLYSARKKIIKLLTNPDSIQNENSEIIIFNEKQLTL